ncbi:hypothetical protein DPMN_151797 [Dreissena polymorpha]|uniref:Uncharacterized protein n=1 Tax=Dreissena polymorpha TaxID=45954 RepID=A0A9D4FFR9_DREPO|nr:hypothetical protein DPMN_151797 [Dreissena polymorpha]
MGYLFAIRNLSIEPSIRIRQLQDLQAQYAQEARGKIYYEVQTPPFENTSVPVLKMVKCTPTEEEKRVLDNGSPLASYRIDDEKENSITAQGTMPSVVNQSYAAGDQKGTVRITITDKVSTVFFIPSTIIIMLTSQMYRGITF